MTQRLINFVRAFNREWLKRFQLLKSTKEQQSKTRGITLKQLSGPELKADEPILNQLEDMSLAGNEEAQNQLDEIISSPERLQILSNLRLPNQSDQ